MIQCAGGSNQLMRAFEYSASIGHRSPSWTSLSIPGTCRGRPRPQTRRYRRGPPCPFPCGRQDRPSPCLRLPGCHLLPRPPSRASCVPVVSRNGKASVGKMRKFPRFACLQYVVRGLKRAQPGGEDFYDSGKRRGCLGQAPGPMSLCKRGLRMSPPRPPPLCLPLQAHFLAEGGSVSCDGGA